MLIADKFNHSLIQPHMHFCVIQQHLTITKFFNYQLCVCKAVFSAVFQNERCCPLRIDTQHMIL